MCSIRIENPESTEGEWTNPHFRVNWLATMLPKNSADYRTILWALAMPVVMLVQFRNPSLIKYMWPLGCYMALAAGVIAHNHLHTPTFKSKRMNQFFGTWLSVFYGYPTFAWMPTHNLNHQKYLNKAGDATITWRYGNKNTVWIAATYFFVSSYYQAGPIKEYIRKAKENNPKLYRHIMTQYAVWGGTYACLIALAIAWHGPLLGIYTVGLATGVPVFFALWTIMLFNYMQHVHTDPWSEHNHSRSWTGAIVNFLLFNNGLHAVHHEHPNAHWSELPKFHAEIADKIDPRLIEPSVFRWFFVRYFLAKFIPSLQTQQVGRAPFDPPDGELVVETASVDALEAGTNVARV